MNDPGLFLRTVRTSRFNRVRVTVADTLQAREAARLAKWQAIVPPSFFNTPPLLWTAHESSESC